MLSICFIIAILSVIPIYILSKKNLNIKAVETKQLQQFLFKISFLLITFLIGINSF